MIADVGHRLDRIDCVEAGVIKLEWLIEVADSEVGARQVWVLLNPVGQSANR